MAVGLNSKSTEYRVYFAYDVKSIILLLAGGSKQRQSKDIETAKARWSDYKARK
jgi:putative addiction module killer protein